MSSRRRNAPLAVAIAVLAAYALWIGAYLLAGHEPRDFIKLGPTYVQQSHASKVIAYDPTYDYPRNHDRSSAGTGYDGQFSYFMAVDFRNARYYMDVPSYRYTRVLYPVTARGVALGRNSLIPAAMIVVNWLSVALCALALAAWLKRRDCSPWWAAGVALFPGMFLAVQRDLTEPLALALAAGGIWALDREGRRAILLAALLFGLAALARQTTVIFPCCFAVALWKQRRHRDAAILLAGSLIPVGIYTGIVVVWLGSLRDAPLLQAVPFRGLFEGAWSWSGKPPNMLFVVVPALAFSWVVIRAARTHGWPVEAACLLANVALFVALVRPDLYFAWTALGRQSTSVVLAAALCVPLVRRLPKDAVRPAWVAFVLWLALLPAIAVYGFTNVSV